mmetsp:Transcript_28883/g.73732  ORF Transcript_28883/g.73732 Transcript_28883/m.73732 type:complete len:334 (-) Transcript_28883:77-1078(-)
MRHRLAEPQQRRVRCGDGRGHPGRQARVGGQPAGWQAAPRAGRVPCLFGSGRGPAGVPDHCHGRRARAADASRLHRLRLRVPGAALQAELQGPGGAAVLLCLWPLGHACLLPSYAARGSCGCGQRSDRCARSRSRCSGSGSQGGASCGVGAERAGGGHHLHHPLHLPLPPDPGRHQGRQALAAGQAGRGERAQGAADLDHRRLHGGSGGGCGGVAASSHGGRAGAVPASGQDHAGLCCGQPRGARAHQAAQEVCVHLAHHVRGHAVRGPGGRAAAGGCRGTPAGLLMRAQPCGCWPCVLCDAGLMAGGTEWSLDWTGHTGIGQCVESAGSLFE